MERRFVQAMAGLRMSAEEICKVIGAGRNGDAGSDNGKPIAKTTLYRHFKHELENGRAMLKARVAGKFYAALDDDQPWAIQFGMRNLFGWDNGRSGFTVSLPADDELAGPREPLRIEFVSPTRPEHDEPLDVTPRSVNYTPPKPAPPVVDVTANPPTSVPIAGSRKFGWME
jgi:hypothetical protein